jgi:uncharacterized protein involved in copper resistance
MISLIAAAVLAAQAQAAPATPMAGHAQQQSAQKDCCKDCCKDMDKHSGHEMDQMQDHQEHGGHSGR